jgi:hypothetical protein
LIPGNPRSSLAKPPREGVRGLLNRQIHDLRSRLDPRASTRTRARTDQRARAVSDRGRGSRLTGRAQCQGHKRPIGGVTSREAFSCTCNKHDATIRMHARPVRPHKFCQHNGAITFYIGGIITTLSVFY